MKQKLLTTVAAFAAFLILTIAPAQAQWASHGPYGGPMFTVMEHAGVLWAGTNNGVFKSSDNGTTWTAANTGLKRVRINSITFNGTDIIAGSESNGVYFSSTNGNSWTQKNNGISNLHITSLFTTNMGIWAGTPDGAYFSADNGSSWTLKNNGIPPYYDVYCWAQMGDSLYAGLYGQGLWMTNNNGASWTAVSNGFPTGSPTGPFVYALMSYGNSIYAGTSSGIYISNNRGATWMSSNTGMPSSMWAKSFTAKPGYIFAGTHTEGIFVSTNNGASWAPSNNGLIDWPESSGLPHNYETVPAMAISGSKVVAATYAGMYCSSNNGGSWMECNEGILATIITDMACNGTATFAGTDWTGVYVSTDKGGTWHTANKGLGSNFVLAVCAKSDYAFASVENEKVFRTSDNGANWTPASNGLPADPFLMETDGHQVFAVTQASRYTNHKLFVTIDNGNNWSEIIGANAISGGMSALEYHAPYIYIGTSGGSVYRSNNNGASWQDISEYIPSIGISAILATDNEIYIGTAGKGVYKITNNGYTMVSSSNGMTNKNVTDLELQNNVLFASTNGGGVFVSTNKAGNWFAMNEGLDNYFVKTLTGENMKVYAGTDAGVYQTEEGSFDRIAILSGVTKQKEESGIKFYPNPSAGKIYISSQQEETYTINVFDATGKKIYSIEQTAKQSSNEIDLSSQQKGVYFMTFTSNKETFTNRIILQ